MICLTSIRLLERVSDTTGTHEYLISGSECSWAIFEPPTELLKAAHERERSSWAIIYRERSLMKKFHEWSWAALCCHVTTAQWTLMSAHERLWVLIAAHKR